MKILVVEDEQLLRQHLSIRLSDLEYWVKEAANAQGALDAVAQDEYDIAIIDIGLPGINGLDLISELRAKNCTFPILILTARGSWQDKVKGLTTGADDYVVKPFQFEELVARINALTRRAAGIVKPLLEVNGLRLDLNKKCAYFHDNTLQLTAYEYKLLEYLMYHCQEVVTKECLMDQLYSDGAERDSNVIEVLVGRLRKKLEKYCGFQPINTVRGQGYLFTERCH